ncbi:MAG: hypothetical protein RIQ79_1104 [Verrucomicrobiota bacterium]
MNDTTDQQLLSDYAETRAETAFSELVRRHIDLVHSAAFRLTGEAHSAQDVTQAVFLALANDAARLAHHPVLPGWLHTTARHLAAKTIRAAVRRQTHEQEAAAMHELLSAEPELPWDALAPHLDAALGELSEPDRDAILLRYFEKKSAPEIATTLGISAEAAQKRVHRAVDRLRDLLAQRGIKAGAAGLATLLATQAVQAAPVGLAATVSTAVLLSAGTGAGLGLAAAAKTIAMTTLQKSLVTATLALALGFGLYEHKLAARLASDLAALRVQQTAADRHHAASLAELAAENTRLHSTVTEAAADASAVAQDPAVPAMAAWLERVQSLRSHLQTHPELGIPELKLLKEEDWLDAAKSPLDRPDQFRRACAQLRGQAESRFAQLAHDALQKYAAAHAGHSPSTTDELAGWFKDPVDPAMLDRWTMLPANDPEVRNMGIGGDYLFTQKDFIDEDYDSRQVASDTGRGSMGMSGQKAVRILKKVGAAYAAAHPGKTAATPAELLPYATTPEEQSLIRHQITQAATPRPEPLPEMDPLVAAAIAYAAAHPGKTLADELQLLLRHATTPAQKAALQKLLVGQVSATP